MRTRRFTCDAVLCGRQRFAERFGDVLPTPDEPDVSSISSTIWPSRLEDARRRVFAQWLILVVSNDTLLRVIRRQGLPPSIPPSVIGIDDWASRRNHRYGSCV